uniref:Cytochrome c oxidase subunit 7A-related protein, mitochondrial-like n=1 Tax=Acanthochromis polyacanthus TaxID=80966 RepID=A0A3Q1F2P4_9TELE
MRRSAAPQGLHPGVPPVRSPAIFVTPTKLGSEVGSQMEYRAATRVLSKRRLFQVSDSVPVHLKKERIDMLLYRTTLGLRVGGVVSCLVALYVAAQPSNK